MDRQNTTEEIRDILKIYTPWKASQPLLHQQEQILQQKLNPKYKPCKLKNVNPPLLSKRKELHLIEFKSKELIPLDIWEREESPKSPNKEEDSLHHLRRKKVGTSKITRYKSVQNMHSEKQSRQQIIRIKVNRGHSSNSQTSLQEEPQEIPKANFKIRKRLGNESPDKAMSPTLKAHGSWKDLRLTSRKEYTYFLKSLIKSDLHIISRHCSIDMGHFLFKVKKEEAMRKARALHTWQHFNYTEIQD